MQAMGRKIGYIPAAARLADPAREMPLQIYLAESPCTLAQLADQVNDQLRKTGPLHGRGQRRIRRRRRSARCSDSFGHTMFSASQLTVAQVVVNYLNQVGLAAKGAARGNVPGTDQRHAMALASTVDLEEAYASGQMAAHAGRHAARAVSWRRSCASRARSTACATTRCRWPKWPTASERFRPQWIAASGYDVTDDFVRYAKPLVGEDMLTLPMIDGRFRMTRFSRFMPRRSCLHMCRKPTATPELLATRRPTSIAR